MRDQNGDRGLIVISLVHACTHAFILYQRDWNDEEHFRWEEAAIKTVERKNLEDAIRMSEKLRTLKYARRLGDSTIYMKSTFSL